MLLGRTRDGTKETTFFKLLSGWIRPSLNEDGWKVPLEHERRIAVRIYLRRLVVVCAIFVIDIALLGLCRTLGFGQAGLIISGVLMVLVSILFTLGLSESFLRELMGRDRKP
jgi:hypothetical protein